MHSHGPILLAGDEHDIDVIVEFARQLPHTSAGEVFGTVLLEVDDTAEAHDLGIPPDLGVHWLQRDGGQRGRALTRAVTLWVQEWITDFTDPDELPQVMWVGCAGAPVVGRMCHRLARRHHTLHLHHAGAF